MGKKSAGILAWRLNDKVLEVLLAHPGGPFFSNKDLGSWTIPKGEIEEGEDPLAAAQREFAEELGMEIAGPFLPLTPIKQKGGKQVYAWAVDASSLQIEQFQSNTFSMEWPLHSGKMKEFPEIDKAEWFTLAVSKQKVNAAQVPLLEELDKIVRAGSKEYKP